MFRYGILFLSLLLPMTFFPHNLSAKDKDGKIVIGFSLGTLREDRWVRDHDMFVERAKKSGAKVNSMFANNDVQLQLRQAENLIFQGVDVLVVVAQDKAAAAKIVEMAHAEGVKVIAYDRMIEDCDLDFYISFDNIKVGEMEALGVLNVVNKGDFAYIGGSPLDNNALLVKKGAFDILQPKIDNKDIRVVLDEFSADWKSDEAFNNLKRYLDQHKKIDGVVCANDGTAFGAILALKAHDLDGKVPVSGQDAELTACRRIIEGTQTSTVYKPIHLLADKAVEVAIALAKGATFPGDAKVNNGKIDVPACLIAPVAVTRENMVDTVIKDGFHSYEDVFIEENKGKNRR